MTVFRRSGRVFDRILRESPDRGKSFGCPVRSTQGTVLEASGGCRQRKWRFLGWVLILIILRATPSASATPSESQGLCPSDGSEGPPAETLRAEDPGDIHALLFRANQAYLEGRYEEASRLYKRLADTGHRNGHVFFNLGNTFVRQGELGKAILYYKKAAILLPRDGDLKANLKYARSLTKDRIEEGSPSLRHTLAFWYFGMNLREMLIAVVCLNALFWASAVLNLYRDSEWAKWTLFLSLLFSLLLGASAGWKHRESFRNTGGVVLADEAPVRAGFSRNDTILFVLHEGAEFTILGEEMGWYKISLWDGKKGWVNAQAVGRVALARYHPIAR